MKLKNINEYDFTEDKKIKFLQKIDWLVFIHWIDQNITGKMNCLKVSFINTFTPFGDFFSVRAK